MEEKKAQSKSGKVGKSKEKLSIAKTNTPAKKAVSKAAASKDAVTAKTDPVVKTTKAPVKKAVNKAASSKATGTAKPDETKSNSAKKKPAAKKAKTPVKKVADHAKKTKGKFARKMDEVKSAATAIGHKIAEVAKDANEKEEGLEAAIASSLHDMKKDIHRAAEKIAEKTKE